MNCKAALIRLKDALLPSGHIDVVPSVLSLRAMRQFVARGTGGFVVGLRFESQDKLAAFERSFRQGELEHDIRFVLDRAS